MPRNGSGGYSLPEAPFVYDTVISETAVNSNNSDIAAALTGSLAKDGQTNPTANLPMATYRHTGVGNAQARTDYAAAGQVQDGSLVWCGTAGGTANALTLAPTPSISAYATGQRFVFKAGASPSTSTVTIAVSGLATKAAEFNDAALSSTAVIEAGKYYEALYDGTAFQLTRLSGLRAGEVATANIADDAVTYAKIQNVVTNGRLLGRTSGAGGPVEEVSLPSIMAFLGDTQGDILYRSGSAWTVLNAGTAGAFLKTGGAGANPSWQVFETEGSETATTSGATVELGTSLSGLSEIMILFNGVSLTGTDSPIVQIGDSGGYATTSYAAQSGAVTSTAGFVVEAGNSNSLASGIMWLRHMGSNLWISSHSMTRTTNNAIAGGGTKTLSGALDRIRLAATGSDTFDAGSAKIIYR